MNYRGWTGLRRLALAGLSSSLFLGLGAAGAAGQQPVAPAAGPSPAGATSSAPAATPVSLDQALQLAEQTSEQVMISQAGVLRARGQQYQARSQLLPQVAGTAGYTRTLATQFSGLSSSSSSSQSTGPSNCPTGKFVPNPALPLDQRVDSLELRQECSGSSNPFGSLKNLPFGQANQWSLGLNVSQNLFTGGRVLAQITEANASRELADIGLSSTRAQLMLDVAQAYYDAALSDRLLAIAQGALSQAQQTLQQVQVARQVGSQPEFELLRAQVAYQNEQPVVIQRRSQRDLAYLRLKQLLNLPPATAISLTTALGDTASATPVSFASAVVSNPGDTTTADRAPVRQAAQALRTQEAALKVARSERIPSLALVSQWGRVGYTSGIPSWQQMFTNWTVGVSLSLPLFTGGRVTGDQLIAQAGLMEARARLRQTTELAALDTRSAQEQLQASEATYNASAGTAQQATRAYQIAQVRYKEGISTQLELNDSRLMVQQAEANRAQAARDLQLARIRLALLPNLPLGASSGTTNASAAGQTGSVGGTSTQAAPQPSVPLQAAPQAGAQQGAGQGTTQTGTSAVSASRVPINQ